MRLGHMVRIFAMKASGLDFSSWEWDRYLSTERRERAQRHINSRERQLYLGAEALMNRSLERMGKGIPIPAAYVRNSCGKPYLKDVEGIYMNWSHSGEYVLCAVADREIGIDLQFNQKEPRESLIRKVLRVPELEFYQSLDAGRRKLCFYEFWTLKESFLKALGTGFYTPLERFCIQMEDGKPRIVQDINEKLYSCALLDFPDKEYTAAVCYEGDSDEARIEHL